MISAHTFCPLGEGARMIALPHFKAFNVLSAYTLENGGIQGSKEVNCNNKTYNSVIRDRKAVKTKV